MNLHRLLLSCKTRRLAVRLHAILVTSGRAKDVVIQTKLINLYARIDDIVSARITFERTTYKSIVTWNSIISCYARFGLYGEAMEAFRGLLACSGARPDGFTFPVTIKACGDLRIGSSVHALVVKHGFREDVFVSASLVHMYSRVGRIGDACKVFDEMVRRDLGAWNAMVSGFCQNGKAREAAEVFGMMVREGVGMDKVTVSSVLPVCAPLGDIWMGRWIHLSCVKRGLDADLFVLNALIDMYAKLDCLEDARRVFDAMGTRDIVTWNSLISGYEQAGNVDVVLELFDEMERSCVRPDMLTLVMLASMAAQCGEDRNGRLVHGYVMRRGWDMDDIVVSNAIVDMYGKLTKVEGAQKVFDRMRTRDVVTWNTLITSYSQNGFANEAIQVYEQMTCEGIRSIQGTLVSVLPACSHIGALQKGMAMHGISIKTGLLSDFYVATCLIDLYAKCGKLDEAIGLFELASKRCTGPWNAIIAGLGIHGHGRKAVSFFLKMQEEGVQPDHVTFISLLSACSHAGLVDYGQQCFHEMQSVYGLQPSSKHFACMVDLLGRAGKLNAAYKLIQSMPMKPDAPVWGALLGACRIHNEVDMAKLASIYLFEVDPENIGYYVLMSNMYAKLRKWDGVDEVRSLMRYREMQKTPGWSSVEINKKVDIFYSGNRSHPQYEEIHKELMDLLAKMKSLGYVPDYSYVLQDVEDDEKEHILTSHSERLAIAFAIISTSPKTSIQIYKNLRVCGDCHNATKFISRITDREIIVRDSNRFHHFKHGSCSCGDYW